jgi:hypothetical protein
LYQVAGMKERLRQLADASSDVILRTHVEPADTMIEERSRASIDSKLLAAFMNGGIDNLNRKCATSSPIRLHIP